MSASFDVLTIGNAIVDVIARADDDFLVREGVAKGSMRLIDEAMAERLYAVMGPATIISGGSAANTATGIASLGGQAAFIGKIKADPVGDTFMHDIRAAGVAFDTPRAAEGPATARSFILVTPDGERTMNTFLGACQNLTVADVDPAVVSAAKVTYLEGYLWDPPAAKDAFRKAADIAHAAGREVAITLSDSFCVDRYRAEFLELLRSGTVDLVFANKHEARALYETADTETAIASLRKDARHAVVTLSEEGALYIKGGFTAEAPAHPISDLVDLTGAGDLFAAGFLHGYTRGETPVAALKLGAMAAAHVIENIGARPRRRLADIAAEEGLVTAA